MLKFSIVLSHLACPVNKAILPLMNFLLSNIETNKVYKDTEVNK